MIFRFCVAACFTVAACGSSGIDATTGMCVSPSASQRLTAYNESNGYPSMSLAAPVTVDSIRECPSGDCGFPLDNIVLAEASGRRWRLEPRFPGMAADIVSVGEALDLRIEHRPIMFSSGYLTIVLSRGGTAVMFDASQASDLVPYGITVAMNGTGRCFDGCYDNFGADVTYGTESRTVGPSQTVSVGKLTLTHHYFRDQADPTTLCGNPHAQAHEESMAGFVAR